MTKPFKNQKPYEVEYNPDGPSFQKVMEQLFKAYLRGCGSTFQVGKERSVNEQPQTII